MTFEYVMLKGVNDTPAEARTLVRLAGRPAKINLIPFNPWPAARRPLRLGDDRALPGRPTRATRAPCARRAAATSSPPAASSRAKSQKLRARARLLLEESLAVGQD